MYIRAFWQHLVVKWRGRNSASSVTHITDHVLFVFFIAIGYFFFISVAGCGKVFMIRKVEYE